MDSLALLHTIDVEVIGSISIYIKYSLFATTRRL
jgi:hypothetical protein